jgi:hypothetical protein
MQIPIGQNRKRARPNKTKKEFVQDKMKIIHYHHVHLKTDSGTSKSHHF